MQGSILPKQFIEIKLTLISNILPSIYEGEIECKINWVEQSNSERELQDETLFLRIKKKSQLLQIKNLDNLTYEA
jgi:hypothetical protein